jgi:hypothetical protein
MCKFEEGFTFPGTVKVLDDTDGENEASRTGMLVIGRQGWLDDVGG